MTMINTVTTVHELEMGLNTKFDIEQKATCHTEKELKNILIGKRELDKVVYNLPDGSTNTCTLYSVGSERAFSDIFRLPCGELIRVDFFKVVPW